MGIIDSAIFICEETSRVCRLHGYTDIAASMLGHTLTLLLERGDINKAKRHMDIYEAESGFFDSKGNIELGREIYYYSKGQYYLAINRYDSAEYWFRKELLDGKDFNNQNAASRGLALLFQRTNRPDSAAKYALYSYEMNDSCYHQTVLKEILKSNTLYNYIHYQEIAQEERNKSALATKNLWISLSIIIVLIMVAACIITFVQRDKKEKERKYQKTKNELAKTQIALINARSQETEYKEIICKMEKNVENLKNEISQYNKNNESRKKSAKERLIVSKEYTSLHAFVAKGQTLTDEDIEVCHRLTIEYFPHFYEFISSKQLSLNNNEFNTCILIKLYIKPNSIGCLLGISSSYVSKMRSDMLYKLFGIIGKAKEFDEKLQEMD